MKHVLVLLVGVALALPATALAKGPASATIDGPGTGGGMTFKGGGENVGMPLGDLAHYAGFFPAVFQQTPDPMQESRPKGDLGAKYEVTYTVPGPNNDTFTIKQDVYPYANPPVSYTKPGQKIWEVSGGTRGGWYVSTPALRERLIEAGLPRTPPTGSGSTADDASFVSTGTLLAIVAATALLLLGSALVLRRRTRPAAA
jgi:hypothetical protein